MTDLTMSQFASKDDLLAAQAARIAELEAELEAVGAGGVQRLAAAPQAVQAAVPDGWQMVPAKPTEAMVGAIMSEGEVDAVAGLAPELRPILLERAGIAARYTAMLAAAPAHPAEGVPAQIETLRSELAEEKEAADNWRRLAMQFDNHRLQALWHLKRILHADSSADEYKAAEQFLAAPPLDGEAVLAQRIAALAATQPAAQGVDVVQAAKALCKHAAKVQNVNFDDYWLIHAEEFKEEAQIVLDAAQAKQGGA